MKKLKRFCSLTVAIAFLLNSVPCPAYAMKKLLPDNIFPEGDEGIVRHNKRSREAADLLRELKNKLDLADRERAIDMAKAVIAQLKTGVFKPESGERKPFSNAAIVRQLNKNTFKEKIFEDHNFSVVARRENNVDCFILEEKENPYAVVIYNREIKKTSVIEYEKFGKYLSDINLIKANLIRNGMLKDYSSILIEQAASILALLNLDNAESIKKDLRKLKGYKMAKEGLTITEGKPLEEALIDGLITLAQMGGFKGGVFAFASEKLEKKVYSGDDIVKLLSQKAVIDNNFLKTLEGKVIGYGLDLNIKHTTDARYTEAVRALTELRRRLNNLGVRPKAIVIISHRGRPESPEDINNPKFRVEPVAEWLSREYQVIRSEGGIGEEVRVISETTPEALAQVMSKADGGVYFLQNTRLNPLITKKEDDPDELKRFAEHFDALILGDWGRSGAGDLRGISAFVPTALDSIALLELETMVRLMNTKKPILTILAGIKEEKAEQFLPLVKRHKQGSTIYVLGPTGYTVQTIIEEFILGKKPQLGRSKLVISQKVLNMLRRFYQDEPILENNPVIEKAIKEEIERNILSGINDEKELNAKKKKLEQELKIVESVIQGWFLAQEKGVNIKWAEDHLVTPDDDIKKGFVGVASKKDLESRESAVFFGEETFEDIISLVKKYDNVYVFGAPGVFENKQIGWHEFNHRLLATLESEKGAGRRGVYLFGGDTDVWSHEYDKLSCSTGGGSSLQTWVGEEPIILTSAWNKTKMPQAGNSSYPPGVLSFTHFKKNVREIMERGKIATKKSREELIDDIIETQRYGQRIESTKPLKQRVEYLFSQAIQEEGAVGRNRNVKMVEEIISSSMKRSIKESLGVHFAIHYAAKRVAREYGFAVDTDVTNIQKFALVKVEEEEKAIDWRAGTMDFETFKKVVRKALLYRDNEAAEDVANDILSVKENRRLLEDRVRHLFGQSFIDEIDRDAVKVTGVYEILDLIAEKAKTENIDVKEMFDIIADTGVSYDYVNIAEIYKPSTTDVDEGFREVIAGFVSRLEKLPNYSSLEDLTNTEFNRYWIKKEIMPNLRTLDAENTQARANMRYLFESLLNCGEAGKILLEEIFTMAFGNVLHPEEHLTSSSSHLKALQEVAAEFGFNMKIWNLDAARFAIHHDRKLDTFRFKITFKEKSVDWRAGTMDFERFKKVAKEALYYGDNEAAEDVANDILSVKENPILLRDRIKYLFGQTIIYRIDRDVAKVARVYEILELVAEKANTEGIDVKEMFTAMAKIGMGCGLVNIAEIYDSSVEPIDGGVILSKLSSEQRKLVDNLQNLSRIEGGIVAGPGLPDVHGRIFKPDGRFFEADGKFTLELQNFMDKLSDLSIQEMIHAGMMYYDIRSEFWKENPEFTVAFALAFAKKLQEKTGRQDGIILNIGVDAYHKHFEIAQIFADAILRTGICDNGGGINYWGVINGGDMRNYGQLYDAVNEEDSNWVYFTMSHKANDFLGAKMGIMAKVFCGSEVRHCEGVTSGTLYDYIISQNFTEIKRSISSRENIVSIESFLKNNIVVAADMIRATSAPADVPTEELLKGAKLYVDMGGNPIGKNLVDMLRALGADVQVGNEDIDFNYSIANIIDPNEHRSEAIEKVKKKAKETGRIALVIDPDGDRGGMIAVDAEGNVVSMTGSELLLLATENLAINYKKKGKIPKVIADMRTSVAIEDLREALNEKGFPVKVVPTEAGYPFFMCQMADILADIAVENTAHAFMNVMTNPNLGAPKAYLGYQGGDNAALFLIYILGCMVHEWEGRNPVQQLEWIRKVYNVEETFVDERKPMLANEDDRYKYLIADKMKELATEWFENSNDFLINFDDSDVNIVSGVHITNAKTKAMVLVRFSNTGATFTISGEGYTEKERDEILGLGHLLLTKAVEELHNEGHRFAFDEADAAHLAGLFTLETELFDLPQAISEAIQDLKQAKQLGKEEAEKEAREKLDKLMSIAAETTKSIYNQMAERYVGLRGQEPEERDKEMLEKFIELVGQMSPAGSTEKIRILDAGTGVRDLAWLSSRKNVSAVGIDFSEDTVEMINKHDKEKPLNALLMDMNHLEFADKSFDGVRSNATLHHLPIIDSHQGADVAVGEAYRVLKPGGIFYVLVKAETDEHRGFMPLDTEEELGERLYQFYSKESLKSLLERQGFSLLGEIEEWTGFRGKKNLIAFAKKKGIIDLQPTCGLPIKLPANDKLIFGEGMEQIVPAVRMLQADGIKDKEGLEKVVKDPSIITDENKHTVLYDMYRAVYEDEDLRYDITVIPPRMLGEEYVKTTGHFHPGDYPEVYEVLNGEAYYLLQKKDGSDFIVVHARKGDKVVIPPNYGHITVNAGGETLVMSNWVSSKFSSEYGDIKEKRGGMYYLEKGENGGIKFTSNFNYGNIPPIRMMKPVELVAEFGLEKNEPMYLLIDQAREKLDYLNNPREYAEVFAEALVKVNVQPFAEVSAERLEQMILPALTAGKVYIGYRVFFDEKGNVRVAGIKEMFDKLNVVFGKEGRDVSPMAMVVPEVPVSDSKDAVAVTKMIRTLFKLGIPFVTESEAEQNTLSITEDTAAIDVADEFAEHWHDNLSFHRKTIIAQPEAGEISTPFMVIAFWLRFLSGVEVHDVWFEAFKDWLIIIYGDKIEAEQIRKMIDNLKEGRTFPAIKPTTRFFEEYQDVLNAERVLQEGV